MQDDIVYRLRTEVVWEQEVGQLLSDAAREIERLRLTDAEREAIERVIARIIDLSTSRDEDKKAAVLRGLLARLA